MDLRTLTLTARNMGQLRASHGPVLVVVRRTHLGWTATYYVDGIEAGAKHADRMLKKYVCADSKA